MNKFKQLLNKFFEAPMYVIVPVGIVAGLLTGELIKAFL